MQPKKLYDFASLCVEELGKLVGNMKKIGLANGVKEEEIKRIWVTCFRVLAKQEKISRAIMSQNLKKKSPSAE